MRDVRIAELTGRQFNRVARWQLRELGISQDSIAHRLSTGELVVVESGVYAVAPVLEHDNGVGGWPRH